MKTYNLVSVGRRLAFSFAVLNAAHARLPEHLGPDAGPKHVWEVPCAISNAADELLALQFPPGQSQPELAAYAVKEGRWQQTSAPAWKGFDVVDAALSPEGNRIYFASHHPMPGAGDQPSPRLKLWTAEKTVGGWSEPAPLPKSINASDGEESSPCVTADGTLYFCSSRSGGRGGWDIYCSPRVDGDYASPAIVVPRFGASTIHDETAVSVSADGSLLVFAAAARPNTRGETDLYYTRFEPGRGWGMMCNPLGSAVNTGGNENRPRLSPDGSTLAFMRDGQILSVPFAAALLPRETPSAAWQSCADMPHFRDWGRAVAVGGKLYVGGGNSAEAATSIDEYDPASNRWKSLPDVPAGWPGAVCAALGGKLLIVELGGSGVAEYEVPPNRWVLRTATPSSGLVAPPGPLYSVGFAGDGERLYASKTVNIAASEAGHLEAGYLVRFDERTGWQPAPVMPQPFPQIGTVRGELISVGAGATWNIVQRLAPGSQRWTYSQPIPTGRWEMALVEYRGELWTIGGHDALGEMDRVLRAVESYDPLRDRWTEQPALPEGAGRFGAAAIALGDELFVFGGVGQAGPTKSVLKLKMPPRS